MIGRQYRHKVSQGLYMVVAFAVPKVNPENLNDCQIVWLDLTAYDNYSQFTINPDLGFGSAMLMMRFPCMLQYSSKGKKTISTQWIVYKSAHSGELYARPENEFLDKFMEVKI